MDQFIGQRADGADFHETSNENEQSNEEEDCFPLHVRQILQLAGILVSLKLAPMSQKHKETRAQ